ncbi:MAG: Lrp/AsnC family transcriptional regulator [Chloroflexi bacterium]|nr:Lrp/AsnC family transcriptional regulator [Chloroflexota bacterium]
MHLDRIDQKLLNRLQVNFPLVSQPYALLGWDLGITEDEAIGRIGGLRAGGTIRQIGPLFDAKKLNYKTTLVAMRVTGTELDKAVQLLAEYPVSHAYERDHYFNLWFTLAVPATIDVDIELKKMVRPIKAEACFSLPALNLFKLRVFFDSGADEHTELAETSGVANSQPETGLSDADKKVINEIQQDLPLVYRPFREMAAKLEMSEEEFLGQCQSLLSRGVMRRFSVAVNHRQVGFVANGMACWPVPQEKIEQAGQRLASLREVSHCYERRTNPLWKYNLFAMIHGQAKEDCQRIADKVSADIGLNDGIMLFSTREFKKTRLKYPV